MIPFAPPFIDQATIDEVVDTLKSGWITTGPKAKKLEQMITDYCGCQKTLCLNSATAGLELVLRWFGVGPGDEVILPAYTYSATANVVIHCGATPVLVDVNEHDFNINIEAIAKKINSKTKVIMPVDFAGLPCDYDEIVQLVASKKEIFEGQTDNQIKLGRVLVLSDAAHSLGAEYKSKKTGCLADFTCFSFHAVKNMTTAEGGTICINLPLPFDADDEYKKFYRTSLHGQTKDALAKMQKGAWEYDIVEAGYKCNMPDMLAAIGIAGMNTYQKIGLPFRKKIFETYTNGLKKYDWAITPIQDTETKNSSCHVYALRIKGCSVEKRNAIIQSIFDEDVAVNVHFKPIPLLTFYKNMGYDIIDYPVTLKLYSEEISLPIHQHLQEEDVLKVQNAVIKSVAKHVG